MPPKPGIRTTEFWMHMILQVILLLNTIGVWNYMPPKYTVLVQGILGAFYAFARGLAKISPPSGQAVPLYPIEQPGDGTASGEPPAK
jgi:hypothetical protein